MMDKKGKWSEHVLTLITTDDANTHSGRWHAEMSPAPQQIWSIIDWQFLANECETKKKKKKVYTMILVTLSPTMKTVHQLVTAKHAGIAEVGTNWLTNGHYLRLQDLSWQLVITEHAGTFAWDLPEMFQLRMLRYWIQYSCMSEWWGWRDEARGLSRQTTMNWTGTMKSVLMVRLFHAVICSWMLHFTTNY